MAHDDLRVGATQAVARGPIGGGEASSCTGERLSPSALWRLALGRLALGLLIAGGAVGWPACALPWMYGPGVLITFVGMALAALGLIGVLASRWRGWRGRLHTS